MHNLDFVSKQQEILHIFATGLNSSVDDSHVFFNMYVKLNHLGLFDHCLLGAS